MQAQIVSYRRGRHTQNDRQMILLIADVASKEEAASLIGKKVVWESRGKQKRKITGAIAALHGTKGRVRAIFERGLPGQSLGEMVVIE